MHGWDVSVFRIVNGWPNAFEPFFVGLSEGNKTLVFKIAALLLLIALLAAGKKSRTTALLAIAAVIMANVTSDVLKHTFYVARPCVELSYVYHGVGKLDSSGVVSAHAANMAALAFVFSYRFRWWGLIPIILALCTGLSRIYVGVHYPSQVVFGLICGAFLGFMVVKSYDGWTRMKTIDRTGQE